MSRPSDPSNAARLRSTWARFPELSRRAYYTPIKHQHFVQFYSDFDTVLETIAWVAAEALQHGGSVIMMPLAAHLGAIERSVSGNGLDIGELRESGRYAAIDAASMLTRIMKGISLDAAKFRESVGAAITAARDRSINGDVVVFEEMLEGQSALGYQHDANALEALWNGIGAGEQFTLFCAYRMRNLASNDELDNLLEICAQHSLVVPAES